MRYIIAVVGLSLLLTGWVWVQAAWRRAFNEDGGDEDVLARRMSCDGCTCAGKQACKSETSKREGTHASA